MSDLRLHNRLLTSQLAAEREDNGAKLEDIEAKSRLIIQTLQDRLAVSENEDNRRSERWVREREVWERSVREKDAKLTAMRERMAQWERQMGVVNAEIRQMGDAIRQREQKTEEEKRKREAEWEEERRTWKKEEDKAEDERVEMQRAIKRLIDELRDMNEEINRKNEKQRRVRAVTHRLVAMDKEWNRLRNERRGIVDNRVLQCMKKQHELLKELAVARRQVASSEEEKDDRDVHDVARDTEVDTADSDRERAFERTSTVKRSQHIASARPQHKQRITIRRASATHKQAERERSLKYSSDIRPASSTALWPPTMHATTSRSRTTRPQSAAGLTVLPISHLREQSAGVAGYSDSETEARVRPRLPAAFLSRRSKESTQNYKSLFTPLGT